MLRYRVRRPVSKLVADSIAENTLQGTLRTDKDWAITSVEAKSCISAGNYELCLRLTVLGVEGRGLLDCESAYELAPPGIRSNFAQPKSISNDINSDSSLGCGRVLSDHRFEGPTLSPNPRDVSHCG